MSDPKSFNTSHCTSNNLFHCASEIIVYDSHVVAVTKYRDCEFNFADFEKVIHIPACFSNGYSYIIFVNGENAYDPNHKDNYFNPDSLDYGHKIWLCSGVWTYKKTAATSKEVFDEIQKRFDAYKAHQLDHLFESKPQPNASSLKVSSESSSSSAADEIRKYKQLLDEGIITQEEFEQKKKQLLGL